MRAMGQQWDIKTTHASRSTPMMTAAGIHHYQTFSQPCTTKGKITATFGRFLPDLTLLFNSLGEAEQKHSTIPIIWKQQGQINCIGVLHDSN